MNILFVQDSLGTGGAEKSNANFWYYLSQETTVNLKIVVIEHRSVGIEQQILENGFDVVFLKSKKLVDNILQLRDIIKDFSPDVVHSVLFRSVLRVRLTRLLIKFYHIESLVSCNFSSVRFKDPNVNRLGLIFYKYVNMITHGFGTNYFIAISHEVKKHYIHHLKIKSDKITVIHRGRHSNVFVSKRSEIRDELFNEFGINDNSLLFIHVGRQEFAKGHLVLLNAIKKADDKLSNLDIHFLLCGREGNESDKIKKNLSVNRIKTPLHWLGHRHDLPKLLAASDTFIFPSLYEGLGGALIEAQAAGLPIICSNLDVFSEVVCQENAITFNKGDFEELATQLIRISSSDEMRNQMSKASLSQHKQYFQIEDIHKKMFKVLSNKTF